MSNRISSHSFRNKLNLIDDKFKNNHDRLNFLTMLESTLGINLAVIICICYVINGLCLHCFILKWFFEDITSHLFHFLDDNHVDESCNLDFQNQTHLFVNTTKRMYLLNNSHLQLSEQFANVVYFFYVSMVTLFLTKLKTNKHFFNGMIEFLSLKSKNINTSDHSSHSTSNFIHTVNEASDSYVDVRRRSKNKLFKSLFASSLFYVLILLMLMLTISISSFKLSIECEDFFKNNSQMVSSLI